MSSPNEAPQVKSADRALRILEILAQRQPMRFTELASALQIPKGSLHALLAGLEGGGWLTLDRNRGIELAYRALTLELTPPDHTDIVRLVRDEFAALRDRVQETVHVGTLDGDQVVYLASWASRQALTVNYQPGRRLPAHSTGLGKVMLAQLPRAAWRDRLTFPLEAITEHTLTGEAEIEDELARIASRGFAEDHEEGTLGIRCLAVPITHADLPLLAVSCSIPTARFVPERQDEIIAALEKVREVVLGRLRPVS